MKKRRPKGTGSITYEKKRNTYLAAIRDPMGERIQKRFKSEEDAEKWILELRHQFSIGTYSPESDITYGEWLIQFLKVFKFPNIRPSTRYSYQLSAKKLYPLFKVKLNKLTPIVLQKYINEHPEGRYRSVQLNLLYSSLKKAYSLGYINKDITSSVVKRKKNIKPKIDIIPKEDFQKLCSVAMKKSFKDYVLLVTLFSTGIRRGECLALTWSDIDFINKTITINKSYSNLTVSVTEPKNKYSYRTISISDHLASLLTQLKKRQSIATNLVFHTENGKVYTTFINYHYSRYCKAARIKHYHIHAYRHTHASILLNAGIPITDISKRLGHANPNITLSIYSHVIEDDTARKNSIISDIFDNILIAK